MCFSFSLSSAGRPRAALSSNHSGLFRFGCFVPKGHLSSNDSQTTTAKSYDEVLVQHFVVKGVVTLLAKVNVSVRTIRQLVSRLPVTAHAASGFCVCLVLCHLCNASVQLSVGMKLVMAVLTKDDEVSIFFTSVDVLVCVVMHLYCLCATTNFTLRFNDRLAFKQLTLSSLPHGRVDILVVVNLSVF